MTLKNWSGVTEAMMVEKAESENMGEYKGPRCDHVGGWFTQREVNVVRVEEVWEM